jgi:D-methionine transport system ATP-binding protein
MIFQHFNLLSSRTVFNNVALPLELAGKDKAIIEAKVSELLELVGLADKRDTYPANLSGGQKQRVAIARALASDPKVLLCDEATSALDPATTQSILELLREINRKLNITILLITHEMDVVKSICHEVAIIGGGELVEKGTVGDIFAHPKTELAHQFIRSTLDLTIPEDYQARLQETRVNSSYPLVRLEFTGATVDAPLMTQIARKFNIDVSILSSDLDYAGGVKFGMMVAELFGNEADDNAAIQFLRDNNVKVEVLGYVL